MRQHLEWILYHFSRDHLLLLRRQITIKQDHMESKQYYPDDYHCSKQSVGIISMLIIINQFII